MILNKDIGKVRGALFVLKKRHDGKVEEDNG